ncbi:helix-turn-helix domain-containing protein, partial [Microbacterium sp.]|uniref:helix-turn-helix domain-containing protein n=1 Tax=Microbacterium sp. TaxID=51671 RepID=UPI00352388AC
MSRRCLGCSHPLLRSQDQAALSFNQPATTSQQWSPFISTRSNSASWRTMTSPHSGSLHTLRGYPAHTSSVREVRRARTILRCEEGMSLAKIGVEVGMDQHKVGMWRKRFLADGLDG